MLLLGPDGARAYAAYALLYRSTDAILVPRFLASRIHERLAGLTGWKRVYRDRSFEIFARAGAELPVVDAPAAAQEGAFP